MLARPLMRRALLPLFALTLFASSALLFLLEPMFAKMILPLLGGAPAVWSAALLFFQAALLAGYAYAHATTTWLGTRRQAVLHVGIVLLPLLVLPIGIPAGWVPPATGSPVLWLLALLTLAIGLPFFVVSTTAPLLQRWFSRTTHTSAQDPYFLYRASNLGSMLALLVYPLALEPTFRLGEQARGWSIGYGVLATMTIACAVLLRHSPRPATSRTS